MGGVGGRRKKVLYSRTRFDVEVSGYVSIFVYGDSHVQKRNTFGCKVVFGCELDVGMLHIQMVYEFCEFLSTGIPNKDNIIDVSAPVQWLVSLPISQESCGFEPMHKEMAPGL